MLTRARMTAVSGDRDGALMLYSETCQFLKDPAQTAQKLVRDSACTVKELMEKGMDVHGASSNYVSRLEFTQYENMIDSEVGLLRTIEDRMDKLQQHSTRLEAAKMEQAMDEALSKVSEAQSQVDESVGESVHGEQVMAGLRRTGQKARISVVKNADTLDSVKKVLDKMPAELDRSKELVDEINHRFSEANGQIMCAPYASSYKKHGRDM